jgi:hypothetical protein
MSYVRSLLCAVVAVVFLTSSSASAQPCDTFDPTEYNTASEAAEKELAELEKLANTILETGVITSEDGARVDSLMNSYANNFYMAYQVAHAAADQASQSEGQEGDARLLTDFELLATSHESRTVGLALKWEKIHASYVQGDVQEASLLMPGEGSPLRQLTQEGQQQLTLSPMNPDFQALLARAEAERNSFSGMCKSAASSVSNLLVPTAHAALVWKCVKPCKEKKWSECWQCISNAGPAAINAWNDFTSCWNKNSKWWWRTWCLAQFVARLA